MDIATNLKKQQQDRLQDPALSLDTATSLGTRLVKHLETIHSHSHSHSHDDSHKEQVLTESIKIQLETQRSLQDLTSLFNTHAESTRQTAKMKVMIRDKLTKINAQRLRHDALTRKNKMHEQKRQLVALLLQYKEVGETHEGTRLTTDMDAEADTEQQQASIENAKVEVESMQRCYDLAKERFNAVHWNAGQFEQYATMMKPKPQR